MQRQARPARNYPTSQETMKEGRPYRVVIFGEVVLVEAGSTVG